MYSYQTDISGKSATLKTLQELIASVIGETEEILPSMLIEEFSLAEFPKIIGEINKTFKINLNAKTVHETQETIADLIELIDEETELG